MEHIRTIKPEFFRDGKLCRLEPLARLAFVGLWVFSDREGRFAWVPEELRVQVFPYQPATDFMLLLDTLHADGLIGFYQGTPVRAGDIRPGRDEVEVGFIVNWKRHQYVNHREAASRYGAPGNAACYGCSGTHGQYRASSGSGSGSGSGYKTTSREDNGGGVQTEAEAETEAKTTTLPVEKQNDYPLQCIVTVNRALDAKLAGAFKPLVARDERDVAQGWERDGLPLDRVLTSLQGAVLAFQSRRGDRQPHSLKYFDGVVRRDHAKYAAVTDVEPKLELVCAYAVKVSEREQLVTDSRRAVVLARLQETGGDVSPLLFALDGVAGDEFHRRTGQVMIEDAMISRGKLERWASVAGWKPGRVHRYADAEVTAR